MNIELLTKYMSSGYNCTQCVFCYFGDRYGIEHVKAKRIAEAFESGMFSGEKCGAISGAYMVLGLEYGNDEENHRNIMKEKVLEFDKKFIEKNNTYICNELLGEDITTDEGFDNILKKDLFAKVCPKAIISAVEILEKML